jgi:hypothetical protein
MIKPASKRTGCKGGAFLLFCLASRDRLEAGGGYPQDRVRHGDEVPCHADLGQRGATTPRPDRLRPRHPTGAGPMTRPGKLEGA